MSACTFHHLLVRLSSLCLGVCLLCTRLSKRFSAVHSVVIVCEGGTSISSSLKLLLKFQNALKHTESRSSFACNQNIKEDIPRALEVFPCFETNGATETDPPGKYPRNV